MKMAPINASLDVEKTWKRVCVLDASGRLGSTIVQKLLLRGYTVHAALQDPGKIRHLEGYSCNDNKVSVFHWDPFDYRSVIKALKGCCGLFYSFEPPSDQPTYDEYIADVEVRAAHNVLEACAQTETIQKVVFTSSVTAVIWRNDRSKILGDLDERNWSDINFCKEFKLWHALSKTLAEKTAWALAMDRGINMVTVNGGLLMSPDLSITDPYLKGAAEMYEDGVFVTVDLNFLVEAHICIFEDNASYGRFLCFDHIINCNEEAVKLSHMLLPPSESTLPQRFEDTRNHQQRISNKKLSKIIVDFKQ